MNKISTGILVIVIMIIAILGITNPGHKPFQMFDNAEGRLVHNYFVISIYQQYSQFTTIENGKYRLYKRYLGVADAFYEISPLKVDVELTNP